MAQAEEVPHDLVAIFHASFHPTKGNTIDWAFKARQDISLDALEFNALPSGLHLIEQDVVYFTKNAYTGVCVFRRRKTTLPTHRGFKLSSIGVLLEKGTRPRAWKHVSALKELLDRMYEEEEEEGNEERGKELAKVFFEERKVRNGDEGRWARWEGWGRELDDHQSLSNPTLHLPHLLRILGPSTMTLYKHVLARRRILIYTLPPVEAACMLCRVAGDMCFEAQAGSGCDETHGQGGGMGKLNARSKEPIAVLGMITLTDVDRLGAEGGWIACTTDAIFLEKPQYYDLLIDLTTSTPNRAARPTFYASKQTGGGGNGGWRLSTVRFSWSDVKLWTELERILSLSSPPSSSGCCADSRPHTHHTSSIMSSWADVWRVYEDVCVICAGLWMGSWKSGQGQGASHSHGGGVRLEGDDDILNEQGEEEREGQTMYVRNRGMGIEGVPLPSSSGETLIPPAPPGTTKKQRRSSALTWPGGTFSKSTKRLTSLSSTFSPSSLAVGEEREEREELTEDGVLITLSAEPGSMERGVGITIALLQTFHAHTVFQVGVLEGFVGREGLLPTPPPSSNPSSFPSASRLAATLRERSRSPPKPSKTTPGQKTLTLSPKDVLAFELGPLSGLDARYLEWLVAEYVGGAKVVVKRGWRDWVGLVWVGYG